MINRSITNQAFLAEISALIVAIFDQGSLSTQPGYIAHVACGDGKSLRQIFQIIQKNTRRGRALDQFPLRLCAIDSDRRALEKAQKSLKDLPHIAVYGDINRPDQLLEEFRSNGISDTENILYFGWLANADVSPKNQEAPASEHPRADMQNKRTPTQPTMKPLIERLQAWSRIATRHGSILAASHCVPPTVIQRLRDRCEISRPNAISPSTTSDTVEAETFLVEAAKARLFPKMECYRYPKSLPITSVTIGHFERRDYAIRHAEEKDLTALVSLEEQCWPHQLMASRSDLRRRIETYPKGQLVLEMEGAVVGAVYSQRIASTTPLKSANSETVSALDDEDGSIVQLLAVNIATDKQHLRLGDQLLEFMLQRCALINGIESVVGVTRCQNYGNHNDLPVKDYIVMTNEHGQLIDPVLRFHQLHGADIRENIPGYRLRDSDNQGHGVLVVYDIHHRKRRDTRINIDSSQTHSGEHNGAIEQFIRDNIERILGPSRKGVYHRKSPLMEMGLNSVDILELDECICNHYQLNLEPTFFFNHKTAESIVAYLVNRSGGDEAVESPDTGGCRENGTDKNKAHETDDGDAESSAPVHSFRRANTGEAIAVIGIAGCFPGADNKEQLWHLLDNGRDAIGRLPEGRWRWPSYIDPAHYPGIDRGGFLRRIANFDADFFRISPKEAEVMDPQQRILLHLAWAVIEDAGYTPTVLAEEDTGVFVGASGSDYSALIKKSGAEIEAHYGTGTATAMLANRISYFFDLSGPSIQIDTACSSSLVALHEAVKALRAGDCRNAIVGGVHIMCDPGNTISYYRAGMLAKDGRCKTFDQTANGYVRGEGAGLLLLRPLSRAISERDHIYGVIPGSAVNHGGLASGLTVPNPDKQAQLLIKAFENANIKPRHIDYIEAHGTGTSLGDPIEIEGLKKAFAYFSKSTSANSKAWCPVGSIKTNIGHLEAAAGIAGVIKVLLCMERQILPPSLNFTKLNPKINLSASPFFVIDKKMKWATTPDRPRIAGVSSFGFGGTNAHVVLREYQTPDTVRIQDPSGSDNRNKLFILSARTGRQLDVYIDRFIQFLNDDRVTDLDGLAYTLMIGREPMEHRLAVIFMDQATLVHELQSFRKNHLSGKNVLSGIVDEGTEPEKFRDQPERGDVSVSVLKEQWIDQNNLTELAKLWVHGELIDWRRIYGRERPRRISLPTYPFSNDCYWVPENESVSIPQPPERREQFLVLKWAKADVIASAGKSLNANVLVLFTVEHKALAQSLQLIFANSTLVEESRIATINAHEFFDIDGVIDLSTTGIDKIRLLQRLIDHDRSSALTLLYVGRLFSPPLPDAGLYRMLQSEYDHVTSRCVLTGIESAAALGKQVAAEWGHMQRETQVLYQDSSRYLPRLEPGDNDSGNLKLPEDAVLWVTGGTGGLGILCAQYMVNNFGIRRLVLHGRTRANTNYLPVIEALRSTGVDVETVFTPLTDIAQLERDSDRINGTLGDVGMVMHCAGLMDRNTPAFIYKSPRCFREILEPKVVGLQNLHHVMQKQPLKRFVLFSSVSGVLPSLGTGHSDYAMGNGFMDDWARFQHHLGNTYYLSIQWPSWKESGMGEISTSAYQNTGLLSLTDTEGLSLLDKCLGYTGPCILPAVVNPDKFEIRRLLADRLSVAQKVPDARPESFLNESLPLFDRTLQWLTALLGDLLKIVPAKIDPAKPFHKFGVNSIILAQMVIRIDPILAGDRLDPSVILQYPTLRQLSEHLLQQYADALALYFGAGTDKSDVPIREPVDHNKLVLTNRRAGSRKHHEIAVIGIGCHFPDATTSGAYWRNLISGKDSIREVPSRRWDTERFYREGGIFSGKSISRWGAFLEDIEYFDPHYFEITEGLAPQIDPLERQWLEVGAEALADAGFDKEALWGKAVGVFVGTRVSSFATRFGLEQLNKDAIVGLGQNFIAAHLAHIYNFRGPNMVIDAACASSLTAIHLAVQSLRNGESEIALAGGVEILLDEIPYITLSTAGVLSPDGKCKTFDEQADGIGLGEGCGALVLKPLENAVRDGDKIYGILEGTAINNDGNTMGITTPNPEAQEAVIASAIADAGISPETISYIEAHGTGTLIGDPIELKGLTNIFESATQRKRFCGVGSVKSNMGHLLSAAGVAGIIKILLSIVHRHIPPTLHCRTPNPRFNFNDSPFYPALESQPWDKEICRAGISAFGLGGNNAHIILSNQEIPAASLASTRPRLALPDFRRQYYWPVQKAASRSSLSDDVIEDDSLFAFMN